MHLVIAWGGLFIGGGFPELFMRELQANVSLRTQIASAIADGLPTYAECGGLMYLARSLRWRGERCDMEAGMAKYFSSEAAVRNSEEAMRIHGGYAYSKEYEIERYYRDALLMCIGEGTNEMQRIIIAKQLIKRNPV